MKRKITIGIDQSIRFTGITVVYNDTSDLAFYGITNKISSKWKKVSKADFPCRVEVREYTSIQKPDDYSEAEVVKFNNIYIKLLGYASSRMSKSRSLYANVQLKVSALR